MFIISILPRAAAIASPDGSGIMLVSVSRSLVMRAEPLLLVPVL